MTERHHCILIGNGTSVRDHTRGAEIDAFENVVRFNRYLIEGHEAHVGTKTDYWFNVDLPKHVGRRIEVPYKRIYLHNWEPDAENDDLYQSFRRALPGGGFEKISHSLLDEITRYAETPEYQTWSTGAMAIWLMLKNFPHLWLTGFDWWAREEHHYGDATPRGALHRPNLEKQYIDRLLAEKKVTFL